MNRSHSSRPFLRRALDALLALCVVAGTLTLGPAPALAAYPTFTFNGTGWGHGIGLSQYGAKGWAEHGKLGEWIASYYYPGTHVGTLTDPSSVQVNLDAAAKYSSSSGSYNAGYTRDLWQLRPGYTGGTLTITSASGVTTSLKDDLYSFTASAGAVIVKGATGSSYGPYTGSVTVKGSGTPALVEVVGRSGLFSASTGTDLVSSSTNVRYRGSVKVVVNVSAIKNSAGTVTQSANKLKLLNVLAMNEYLYGVVPRESPSSWSVEALKAQAIVARSYAYSTSPAELYCTTYSQAYNGHSRILSDGSAYPHEATSSNSAVDATSARYVIYGTSTTPVKTYFFSSSGGHTANIEDVWLSATPQPYYKGVSDPYDDSPSDPWNPPVTVDGLTFANKIKGSLTSDPAGAGTTVWVSGISLHRVSSGHVRTVDLYWSNGAVSTGVAGDTVRSVLGMRSTNFYVGAPVERIAFGGRYETAVEVSKKLYPTGSAPKAVVVANGDDAKFADALTASGLAGVAGGPVLLVRSTTLDSSISAEVTRLKGLGATKVYIVGGTGSVSAAVASALDAAIGGTSTSSRVERLAGDSRYGTDRYGTAASVAMKIKSLNGGDGTKVLIASGQLWSDAAIASAVSAGSKRPIVLTTSSALPAASKLVLADLGARETAVFGGTTTIGSTALAQILSITKEAAPAKRFGTSGTRYDVAVQAAQWCTSTFGYTTSAVVVATGEKFPDSVTGGVLAAAQKNPLILTASASVPLATRTYLSANASSILKLVIVGGTGSVSDGVAQSMAITAN